MSSFQHCKGQDPQKPFPGCIGRMINIFDLSTVMAGTKLLAEKPHRDGSAFDRNRSHSTKKPIDPVLVNIQEKQATGEQRMSPSKKKPSGTPMKMLMTKEMWKEMEHREKPPSVVAKLMGLDSLPIQQPVLSERHSIQEGHSSSRLPEAHRHSKWQEDRFSENSLASDIPSCNREKSDYKDVFEVLQQPLRMSQLKDQSPHKGKYDESSYHKRMALVRQKFTEAKRLATDENLLHSKEFQDAIEVLSSNRDLFLKFLEEPNSLFSKHLHELQNAPLPCEPNCITVSKPSNAIKKKVDKCLHSQLNETCDEGVGDTNSPCWSLNFSKTKPQMLSQPTRIVVLKPSSGKPYEIKTAMGLQISSQKLLEGRHSCGALQTSEAIGSRELAKEITHQMQESLQSSNSRGEVLSSPVLLNGYVGDESSFHRSESEFMEEEVGSSSDSEIVTPTSQHFWDYTNRFGSPSSVTSFSRASHSPDSSVIREAKKRLSKRLALVASNIKSQDQRRERRSLSTLGEMLSEVKKEERLNGSSSRLFDQEQDFKVPSAFLSAGQSTDKYSGEKSPRSLSRSNSVPVSFSDYETIELNLGVCTSLNSKPVIQKEVPQSKITRSSFKSIVSSFFFSRNKKQNRESSTSSSSADRLKACSADTGGNEDERLSQSSEMPQLAESKRVSPCEPVTDSFSTSVDYGSNQDTLSLWKTSSYGNFSQKQKEANLSVLERTFTDDVRDSLAQFAESVITGHPQALCRSGPIESVARSLSRGGFILDTSSSSNPSKSSNIFSMVDEEHEQFVYVQQLISSAGLDNKSCHTFLARWHSIDSPLNPMLADRDFHMKDEEAKCKLRRSNRKLLFDCTNAALLDISEKATLVANMHNRACGGAGVTGLAIASLAEEVWGIIINWSSRENFMPGEYTNSNIVVDRLVNKEVAGRQWTESMLLEMNEFSKEIGGKVLEELVEEALSELIWRTLT